MSKPGDAPIPVPDPVPAPFDTVHYVVAPGRCRRAVVKALGPWHTLDLDTELDFVEDAPVASASGLTRVPGVPFDPGRGAWTWHWPCDTLGAE